MSDGRGRRPVRGTRGATLLVAGALLVVPAALPAGAGADATRPARELTVPAPGWARVALDADALAMIPPGGRLVVLDAGGRVLPAHQLTAPRGTLPIALAATDETADGWSVVFDTGVLPVEYGASS